MNGEQWWQWQIDGEQWWQRRMNSEQRWQWKMSSEQCWLCAGAPGRTTHRHGLNRTITISIVLAISHPGQYICYTLPLPVCSFHMCLWFCEFTHLGFYMSDELFIAPFWISTKVLYLQRWHDLFRSYWNKRATLQLNHCMCYFRIFHLRRFFLTFWKKSIFLEKFKFEMTVGYVCVLLIF